MQKINKSEDTIAQINESLKSYSGNNWNSIKREDKTTIRDSLQIEQKGLCCYCCQNIENKEPHIEHLNSKHLHPTLCFEYRNLLLSCSSKHHCGHAKGTKELSLTPLMKECDLEVKMNSAGELLGKTQRAKDAIETLKLNYGKLRSKRENLYNRIQFVFDPNQPYGKPLKILDEAILKSVVYDLPESGFKSELEYIINKLT